MLKNMGFLVFALGFGLSISNTHVPIPPNADSITYNHTRNQSLLADFADDFDVGELTICSESSFHCKRITCMDLCVEKGEDPLECPLYCNTFTENKLLPKGRLSVALANRAKP